MMRRELKNYHAILTGASSGIGRALAWELAGEGVHLVLTARRAERLRELAAQIQEKYPSVEVWIVPGDITSPTVQEQLIQTAQEHWGGVDLLINNAGVGAIERVDETSFETIQQLINVNFLAVVTLSQKALPTLIQNACGSKKDSRKRRPMIVNLGSIVGLRGTPYYGIYGAMKAAVLAFSDSLRAELHADRVDVLTVCPGTTQTEFFDVLVENRTSPNFPKHEKVSPERVAQKIVSAMKSGKHLLIPHFQSKILYGLNRFSPCLVDRVMTWFVSPKKS